MNFLEYMAGRTASSVLASQINDRRRFRDHNVEATVRAEDGVIALEWIAYATPLIEAVEEAIRTTPQAATPEEFTGVHTLITYINDLVTEDVRAFYRLPMAEAIKARYFALVHRADNCLGWAESQLYLEPPKKKVSLWARIFG